MKNQKLNAVTLKYILIIGIIPLIGGSAFVVYSLFGTLEQKSKEASHAAIDSEVGTENIDHLQDLAAELQKNKDVATRAASIVADSRQYRYQDQIVNDINTYAKAAGVTILGFDFSEGGSNSESGGTTTGSDNSTTSGSNTNQATTPQTTTQTPAAAPGLKTVNASIQLDSPIPLTNFLIFLKYIEQNVTKMQITGVTLTPADNPSLITNPTINITVYTR